MLLLLLFSCWAISCWGNPTSADEPTGILPAPERLGVSRVGGTANNRPREGSRVAETAAAPYVSTASRDAKQGGTYAPILAMSDLLHARRSSADGLLELQYPVYLSHALLLSSAEVTAHDLQRMPLHRFASPLNPGQIAEVPLVSVGGPRAFHMFVLFTFIEGRTDAVAEGLSSQCKDCVAALAAFRRASNAYKLKGEPVAFAHLRILAAAAFRSLVLCP